MQFNIAQLMRSAVGEHRDYDLAEQVQLDDSVQLTSPLRGRIHILRTHNGVLVTGRLTTEAALTCGRCLAQFQHQLSFDLEEQFLPTIDIATGLPVKAEADDLAFFIDQHHLIDLSEAARQNLLVAIPLAPVCHEACLGLCPYCGQDRNHVTCACTPPADERILLPLRALLDDESGDHSERSN